MIIDQRQRGRARTTTDVEDGCCVGEGTQCEHVCVHACDEGDHGAGEHHGGVGGGLAGPDVAVGGNGGGGRGERGSGGHGGCSCGGTEGWELVVCCFVGKSSWDSVGRSASLQASTIGSDTICAAGKGNVAVDCCLGNGHSRRLWTRDAVYINDSGYFSWQKHTERREMEKHTPPSMAMASRIHAVQVSVAPLEVAIMSKNFWNIDRTLFMLSNPDTFLETMLKRSDNVPGWSKAS
jgi:hypothetical protein